MAVLAQVSDVCLPGVTPLTQLKPLAHGASMPCGISSMTFNESPNPPKPRDRSKVWRPAHHAHAYAYGATNKQQGGSTQDLAQVSNPGLQRPNEGLQYAWADWRAGGRGKIPGNSASRDVGRSRNIEGSIQNKTSTCRHTSLSMEQGWHTQVHRCAGTG